MGPRLAPDKVTEITASHLKIVTGNLASTRRIFSNVHSTVQEVFEATCTILVRDSVADTKLHVLSVNNCVL